MVVYRAKFAPTIWAARQLVSHGHIRVNGVKCNIASRRVDVGDVIELGPKAQEMALTIEAQGLAERDVPEYVVADGTAKVTFTRVPEARRGALSGPDGAEPRRRILFALILTASDADRAALAGRPFCCYGARMTQPPASRMGAARGGVDRLPERPPSCGRPTSRPRKREVAAFAAAVHADGKGEEVWLVAADETPLPRRAGSPPSPR